VDLRNHLLGRDPDPPWEGATSWGEGVAHCKVQEHSAVSCAKTAEPFEMPFGLWTRVDLRNHVGCNWCNLANTVEQSKYNSDAVFCQISFDY